MSVIRKLMDNSSVARNGLLIDHNLLEVNGQNVGGEVITVTFIPSHIYNHIMKNMSTEKEN